MVVVKLELWPLGDESKAREIGRTYIANVGGDLSKGNYDVAVCRKGSTAVPSPISPKGSKPTRTGKVMGFPRKSYNAWRLIVRALISAFPEEQNP